MPGRGYDIWGERMRKQPPVQSGRGIAGAVPSVAGVWHRLAWRSARRLGEVPWRSKDPWCCLSLISPDFCSSLNIFTNTSWKLCSHTSILSCLLSCHDKQTSNPDTPCVPGADHPCKGRLGQECEGVPSGWHPAFSALTAQGTLAAPLH